MPIIIPLRIRQLPRFLLKPVVVPHARLHAAQLVFEVRQRTRAAEPQLLDHALGSLVLRTLVCEHFGDGLVDAQELLKVDDRALLVLKGLILFGDCLCVVQMDSYTYRSKGSGMESWILDKSAYRGMGHSVAVGLWYQVTLPCTRHTSS